MTDFQVHDLLRLSHVVRVVAVAPDMITVKEEKSGEVAYVPTHWEESSQKIELLHRSLKKSVKVGDVLDGTQLKKIMWKRGTRIQSVEVPHLFWTLRENGDWQSSNGMLYGFEELTDTFKGRLVSLGQDEAYV